MGCVAMLKMFPSNPIQGKNHKHGKNYFWNKFCPIESDLSIPFNPPHLTCESSGCFMALYYT